MKEKNVSGNCRKIISASLLMLLVVLLALPAAALPEARNTSTKMVNLVDASGINSGNTTVGLLGSFAGSAQEAVSRINEIRKEACQEGVPDPRNTSRNLTPDDYVAIQWDSDLEYVARVRAAEASLIIGHDRPSGKSTFSVKAPSGAQSWGENLAWNFSSTMRQGIEQWYDEKKDWVDQNSNAVTGHYESMIDPDYISIGMAAFLSEGGIYPNCTSGEFSSYRTGSSSAMELIENCMAVIEIAPSCLSAADIIQVETTSQTEESFQCGDTAQLEFGMKCTLKSYTSWVFDDGPLTWSSSNSSVAVVNNMGAVKIVGAGTAVIQVSSDSGRTASIEVTSSHIPGEWTVTKEAACTEAGKKTQKCTGCGKVIKTEDIPAKGHTSVTDKAVAATCTKAGKTAGSHCGVCNKVLTAQKTVPAKGHTPVTDKAIAPTCTKQGKTEGSHCRDCNTVLKAQKSIPAKGHVWQMEYTKATLYEDGSIVNCCIECGEEESHEVIPYPETIELSKTSYTYTGKAKKPAVTVIGSDGAAIDASNYTVSYDSGRKKAGTYKVTITFRGDYSGEAIKTFKIKPAKQTIKVKVSSKTYKAKKLKKKKATFSIGAKTTGKGKLTYKSSKKKYVTVTSKGKVTVKKGTPKGTYKITVTAKATANYKKATKTIKIKVK